MLNRVRYSSRPRPKRLSLYETGRKIKNDLGTGFGYIIFVKTREPIRTFWNRLGNAAQFT